MVRGYIGGSSLVHRILEVSTIACLRCMILEIIHHMIDLQLIPYSIFTNCLRHVAEEEERGMNNSTSDLQQLVMMGGIDSMGDMN